MPGKPVPELDWPGTKNAEPHRVRLPAVAQTLLAEQDAGVYCLGAYTGVVSDEELRRITVDYTIEFARVLRAGNPNAAFSFLSGMGADPTGRSRAAFARYKGEAETALRATGFPHLYIFRPAYIYPVEPRKEPNLGYRILRGVYPVARLLFPSQVIPADDLARAMVEVVVRGTGESKNVVIENKNRENEELLLNVLPAPIANRLRGGEQGIADGFAEVTVAFADIVGFTEMSSEMPPANVVALLNGLFTRFDDAAHELGIEKIKTVGDAYMAVCGMPVQVPDHAERMVRMAIRMVHITREHAMEHHVEMKLRVGINSGPVVAGVIGKSKYIYDLWGDTVNLASRMESGGMPDTIQVTRSVYEKLKGEFVFEPRGAIEVKGKGGVEAWLLKL
jgi:class 3 adenylate cyclase